MAIRANEIFLPGLVANADLSSSLNLAVKYASTPGMVKLVTAGTDLAVGLLEGVDRNAAGAGANVQVDGVAKAVVGTSVGWTADVGVGYNTTGKVVPLAANTTNDNKLIIGRYPLAYGNTTTPVLNQVVSIQMFGGVQRI